MENEFSYYCCDCIYAAGSNPWSNPMAAMSSLSSVHKRTLTLSNDYMASKCMDRPMRQPHLECAMTVIYRKLMTLKPLCPHSSSITFQYIRKQHWEFNETKSYYPNLKCIYDLTKERTNIQGHMSH